MKQVIAIALFVMFLASSVSAFAGDIEVVQGATHLRISCAEKINRLVEWDTTVQNTSGEDKTVKVKCIFLDVMDQTIAEDVKQVKVKAYETKPVKGSRLLKTGDANRILATMVEVQ
jgi:hypothetical protein